MNALDGVTLAALVLYVVVVVCVVVVPAPGGSPGNCRTKGSPQ